MRNAAKEFPAIWLIWTRQSSMITWTKARKRRMISSSPKWPQVSLIWRWKQFSINLFRHFQDSNVQSQETRLLTEKWFHGSISRPLSESLLKSDGDFLVRESQNTRGQYVLTGMKSGQAKHLLLIDPEGCVRTKDRVFDNIPHLINYHWTNCLPIISAESALLLQTPVLRSTELKKWMKQTWDWRQKNFLDVLLVPKRTLNLLYLRKSVQWNETRQILTPSSSLRSFHAEHRSRFRRKFFFRFSRWIEIYLQTVFSQTQSGKIHSVPYFVSVPII